MIAARYGIVTVVELLLHKGADPNAINEVSKLYRLASGYIDVMRCVVLLVSVGWENSAHVCGNMESRSRLGGAPEERS
jgi:hypothetical protein